MSEKENIVAIKDIFRLALIYIDETSNSLISLALSKGFWQFRDNVN